MLRIGPYTFQNCVALAPMAGVTDLPFRRLCHDLGAGLVVSEMLSSDLSLYHTRKSRLRRRHDGEPAPRIVQIAGGDPEQMAAAARLNVAEGADIIDINMGCPAKKVCRKAAGSALLRDEALVAAILEQVVAAVAVPVTLKIRTGWSPDVRNGARIARIAEQSGIAALAVHGRTRACRFVGPVDYDSIAEIVAAVSIPVLANGDIDSPARAAAVLAHTGAAGVMIGRAAQGRPWLPGLIAAHLSGKPAAEPTPAQQAAILLRHLQSLHAFYGAHNGVLVARKHVGWYLATTPQGSAFCRAFNALGTTDAQLDALEAFFGSRPTGSSAESRAA
jgi:tRNA-dihydrouridine synthase B